VSSWQRKR